MTYIRILVFGLFTLTACTSRQPDIPPPTPVMDMFTIGAAPHAAILAPESNATLWRENKSSLFGDTRANSVGDILTVVIEIDDSAEFSNASNASRSDSNGLSIGALFGLPERAATSLPDGAGLDNAIELSSSNSSDSDGSIRRNEKLALRVAATVVAVYPNGSLQISGRQEVLVNFETRLLQVDGMIRPEDISRHNEIAYDKIASARIAYGGKGQINNMARPKIGTQMLTYFPL